MSTNPTTTLDAPEISTIEPTSNRAMPGSRQVRRSFRSCGIAATVAALVLSIVTLVAGPVVSASALTQITPPSNYLCSGARISMYPPRAYANAGRTEQVAWVNQVERYNPSTQQWYVYATYTSYGSFNQFGVTVTGWSGTFFTGKTMNLPVYHRGYYRVATAVGNNTLNYVSYIGGIGNYCLMP